MFFLQTEYGKPFEGDGFHNWLSERIDRAGLPERCTPHGLRTAGCVEMAESGCSTKELMAMAGFESMAVAQKYIEQANKKQLAESGARRRFSSNPKLTH